jgi:hypothetical protein
LRHGAKAGRGQQTGEEETVQRSQRFESECHKNFLSGNTEENLRLVELACNPEWGKETG